jgi:RNA polymerase subunit RPABC4/transcription elongation factor Spt4
MRCPDCQGFAPEGAERCPYCGHLLGERMPATSPAGGVLADGASEESGPALTSMRLGAGPAPDREPSVRLYPWQAGTKDVRGGAFQRTVSWAMAHLVWVAAGTLAAILLAWLAIADGGALADLAWALLLWALAGWVVVRRGRVGALAGILALTGTMVAVLAIRNLAALHANQGATVPASHATAPVPAAGATGVWNGMVVVLTPVTNTSVESLPDAQLVGQLQDFETRAQPQSCLNGETINVWSAPREFPGSYVVHDGAQGAECAYGTWTFRAPTP